MNCQSLKNVVLVAKGPEQNLLEYQRVALSQPLVDERGGQARLLESNAAVESFWPGFWSGLVLFALVVVGYACLFWFLESYATGMSQFESAQSSPLLSRLR